MSENSKPERIDPLENLLAELTCGVDERAENAIPLIISQGEKAIPSLLKLMQSKDEESRWWAIRVLASSQHADDVNWFEHLKDPAPEVRAAIALALCSHPTEKAVPYLIEVLDDTDDLTAGLASKGLTSIGSGSVPALIARLENDAGGSRNGFVHALRALAEIGDHRAIPLLLKISDTGSAVDQFWAKAGLDRLGLNMIYVKPD